MVDQPSLAELAVAIHDGDVTVIRRILDQRPGLLRQRDDRQRTVLHLLGHVEETGIIAFLNLIDGMDVDIEAVDMGGDRPLHHFVRRGFLRAVDWLLARSADVNAKTQRGVTPLHLAMLLNRRTAAFLLDRGADIDTEDAQGSTPMTWALEDGNLDVARMLWDRGARRTVFAAASLGETDDLAHRLDEQPALLHARDGSGNTPLHRAAWNGQEDAGRILLDRGAEIDTRNHHGQTPLHLAVFRYAALDFIKLLLRAGASIQAADGCGRTPLHLAVMKSNAAKVGLLLANGAHPDEKDHEGKMPVELLLERAVDDEHARQWMIQNLSRFVRSFSADGLEVCKLLGMNHWPGAKDDRLPIG